jgi:SAM-dependent methyltransferase
MILSELSMDGADRYVGTSENIESTILTILRTGVYGFSTPRSILEALLRTFTRNKLTNFIKNPHCPYFLVNAVRQASPSLARLLTYGRFNINTRTYWNERYRSGQYNELEDKLYGPLRHAIANLVPMKTSVLDAGCGTGRLMEILRDNRLCTCTGVDISDNSITMARARGFTTFRCRLPKLPNELKGKKFDACTIVETLEHLGHPRKVVKKLSKLINNGGHLIVAVPDECMKPEEFDEHMHSFDRQVLYNLLKGIFHVEETVTVKSGGENYLVVKSIKL